MEAIAAANYWVMSSRLYKHIINVVDKRVPTFARPFWEYEAGPKTMFVQQIEILMDYD